MNIKDSVWASMGYKVRGIKPRFFNAFSEVVGCDRRDLWFHLVSQFKPGMGEKNFGHGPLKWEVGPVEQFDLKTKEGQFKALHYTNLKPVWSRKAKQAFWCTSLRTDDGCTLPQEESSLANAPSIFSQRQSECHSPLTTLQKYDEATLSVSPAYQGTLSDMQRLHAL